MRLVYTATQKPVQIGDTVTTARSGETFIVDSFSQPRNFNSEGRVSLRLPGSDEGTGTTEFYVSVIGAKWIEREDQAGLPPVVVTSTRREADIAAVMEQEQIDRADAEKIVDADKVILGGNWFCLDDSGSLYGGPVNADGTLGYDCGGFVDMPDAFEYPEMVGKAKAMLKAGAAFTL